MQIARDAVGGYMSTPPAPNVTQPTGVRVMDDQELVWLERKHRNCMNACPHRWQAFGKEPHCAHCHQPWEDGGCTVRRLVAALRACRAE